MKLKKPNEKWPKRSGLNGLSMKILFLLNHQIQKMELILILMSMKISDRQKLLKNWD